MAEGVVPRLAEVDEARPRAAGATLVGVVAVVAVAPEIVDGAVAGVTQRRGALPDVLEARVADVAACPRRRGERRAAFDRAVRLDAERHATRAAPAAVTAIVVAA